MHKLGHFSDVKLIDVSTRKELAIVYYRITTFSFDGDLIEYVPLATLNHYCEAFLFRTVDPWHIGSSSFNLLRHVQLKYEYTAFAQSSQPLVLFKHSQTLLRLPAGVHVSLRVTRSTFRYSSEIFTLAKGIRDLSLSSEKLQERGLAASIDVYNYGTTTRDECLFRLPTGTLERSAVEQSIRDTFKKIEFGTTTK